MRVSTEIQQCKILDIEIDRGRIQEERGRDRGGQRRIVEEKEGIEGGMDVS
jgi:hypothetical protein